MKNALARSIDRLVGVLAPERFRSLAPAWRYALALLIVLAVTGARVALRPVMGSVAPYNLAYLGVVVTTVLVGTRPGLLSLVLALGAAEVFIVEPAAPALDVPAVARLSSSLVVGVLIVALVHALRVARVAADESRTRLAAVGDATFEAIIESEGGRVVDCNEQLARMTGRTVAELRGAAIETMIPPEDLARVQANIGANRESVIEHVLLRADGTRLLVEAHGRPLFPGSGRRLTGLRDITERRRAEEERERSLAELREREAELRLVTRRKDEFIAMLSHELRNPLAPIRYALPLLAPGQTGEASRAAAAIIGRQIEHLTRLVDDLLDASRVTGGKIELRRRPAALASIAAAAVEATAPALAAASQTLTTAVPDEPIWLDADAARLTQVLVNLLDNASKYTPAGGRIALEASRDADGALIRVRDDGIGIPPEALPRLFDMFWQANRPDKPQGGLGIGLALARRLVEMHGGTLEARSDGAGCGSTFLVRLPVVPGPPADVQEPAPPRPAPRRLKVLLVDDNADLVEMLTVTLESAGHEVRTARDGRAAIAEAVSSRPDVVLLDLGLPFVSGLDVARDIRRRPELAHARLVALTGWGQEEDRLATQAAGFDHHLTKPTDPDVLLDLLSQLSGEPSSTARR